MLALCHIPKTAGTTVVGILRRSYGPRHCDVEPIEGRAGVYGSRDHRLTRRLHPGLTSIAGHQVSPASDLDEACPDVLYCVVFREPRARIVSQHHHIARRSELPDLAEVLDRPWWSDRQCRQVAGEADADAAVSLLERKDVLVGLTERLDEFLVMLRLRSGDPRLDVRLAARNVAPPSEAHRRLLEDPAARAQIDEANPADAGLWKRLTEEIYPAQCARFPELAAELERLRNAPEPAARSVREQSNRLYRNLVYKPALGVARRLAGPEAS